MSPKGAEIDPSPETGTLSAPTFSRVSSWLASGVLGATSGIIGAYSYTFGYGTSDANVLQQFCPGDALQSLFSYISFIPCLIGTYISNHWRSKPRSSTFPKCAIIRRLSINVTMWNILSRHGVWFIKTLKLDAHQMLWVVVSSKYNPQFYSRVALVNRKI